MNLVIKIALGVILGFILLFAGCSLLLFGNEDLEGEEITHISILALTENWDSNSEEDGIDIIIQAKNSKDDYLYIPKGSKVTVNVYKKEYRELFDFEGEYKLSKTYEDKLYERTYKSYGIKVPLEEKDIKGGGKVKVNLIIPNGKSYSAESTYF